MGLCLTHQVPYLVLEGILGAEDGTAKLGELVRLKLSLNPLCLSKSSPRSVAQSIEGHSGGGWKRLGHCLLDVSIKGYRQHRMLIWDET